MAPDIDTNPESGPLAPTSQWNSIGFKIMLANMLALLILGLGVVMFSEYRRSVVYTELSLLEDEARLWALFLSSTPDDGVAAVAAHLSAVTPRDVTIFDANGRVVFEQRLPATRAFPPSRGAASTPSGPAQPLAKFLLTLFPVKYDLPVYPGGDGTSIQGYPAVTVPTGAASAVNAWVDDEGRLIYTAAVPLTRDEARGGTLLLVKSSTETDIAFQMARLDVVRIFIAALAITLALTLYVAFMVARPLNRLASAARDVQRGVRPIIDIPDLRDRGDEIGALSAILRQTTGALAARLDTIERFAADVAHELKNPLTSLRSAIETLPRVQDADKRAHLMEIMADDTRRLDRLITDISQLSRLDSELARTPPGAANITDVLARTVRAFAAADALMNGDLPGVMTTRHNGVQIRFQIAPDLPLALAHPGRLDQVFGNILGNALSFSPANGMIVVAANASDDLVSVTFDDAGPGIPPGKETAIFNRFYSERPAGEAFGMHSGLGLAIAARIVMSAGGTIRAENRLHPDGRVAGARLIVTLPVFRIDA